MDLEGEFNDLARPSFKGSAELTNFDVLLFGATCCMKTDSVSRFTEFSRDEFELHSPPVKKKRCHEQGIVRQIEIRSSKINNHVSDGVKKDLEN